MIEFSGKAHGVGSIDSRHAEVVDDGADVDVVFGVEDAEVRPAIGLQFIVRHIGDVPLPRSGLNAGDLHTTA